MPQKLLCLYDIRIVVGQEQEFVLTANKAEKNTIIYVLRSIFQHKTFEDHSFYTVSRISVLKIWLWINLDVYSAL